MIVFIWIAASIPAFAESTMNSAYDAGNKMGATGTEKVRNALSSFQPEDVFNHYAERPNESTYYTGDTQTHTTLNEDAKKQVLSNEAGEAIVDSFTQRKPFSINPNSADMQHLQEITQQGIHEPTFCLEEECGAADRIPDADFNASVAELSATADASKQFDAHSIFKGNVQKCSDDAAGFKNCCRDSGWGLDTNLAHCSGEEKELGKNKQNGLSIYVGSYCSKKILGMCVSHKKSYCTFPSKLARLTQAQGRQGMLGINFGSAKDPNCRGLTPEELQKIDFSKIDFSEYYKDIAEQEQLSNPDEVQNRIQEKINTMISGKIQDIP